MSQQREASIDDQMNIVTLRGKVELALQALADVRRLLDGLNETVQLIKVFEVEIRHLTSTNEAIEDDVKALEKQLEAAKKDFFERLETLNVALQRDIGGAKEAADKVERSVSSKVNFLRGALAALTLVGGVTYGLGMYVISGYIEKVERNTEFMQVLKTLRAEEHLREPNHKYVPPPPTNSSPQFEYQRLPESAAPEHTTTGPSYTPTR